MALYRVRATEVVHEECYVEADSEEEAMEKGMNGYADNYWEIYEGDGCSIFAADLASDEEVERYQRIFVDK